MNEEEVYISTKEAARRLGVSTDTVLNMLQRHQIRGYLVSNKNGWRIEVQSIDDFIKSRSNENLYPKEDK